MMGNNDSFSWQYSFAANTHLRASSADEACAFKDAAKV